MWLLSRDELSSRSNPGWLTPAHGFLCISRQCVTLRWWICSNVDPKVGYIKGKTILMITQKAVCCLLSVANQSVSSFSLQLKCKSHWSRHLYSSSTTAVVWENCRYTTSFWRAYFTVLTVLLVIYRENFLIIAAKVLPYFLLSFSLCWKWFKRLFFIHIPFQIKTFWGLEEN